ncbi:MAG: GntR family transcriptional regulator [Pseudomonadota bacterium]
MKERDKGMPERQLSPGLQTLPDQIAERIYAAIVGGQYQPGERIREEELAVTFGVSRGPIREALRILERDSVVRVVPNRGAHVTTLSVQELNDIFEIRRVLSGLLGRRLSKPPPEFLERVGESVKELERRARGTDQEAYIAASLDLTLLLADASGNALLAGIMRSITRQSWRYTQLALKNMDRRKESARNWRALFVALSSGKEAPAAAAMEKLVEDARRGAIRMLEDGQAEDAAAAAAKAAAKAPASSAPGRKPRRIAG